MMNRKQYSIPMDGATHSGILISESISRHLSMILEAVAARTSHAEEQNSLLWKRALWLAWITILYNLIEGVVSVYFGASDETLALFGFGIDSFIETISAAGVLVMINRIRANGDEQRTAFEITALKITGWCFYALSLALIAGAGASFALGRQPESTFAGVIVSTLSILGMLFLVRAKRNIGRALSSQPIISDANCNLVCVYMSVVVLVSSGLFELFHIGFFDAAGALGLSYFSIKEGKEAFEKAKGMSDHCAC